ncbi:MAG: transposase [Xenococcaceae cyanobacterium MO_167.B27]|nr:transposase [Xenococcaceae cyanobacterium MO_167.B27]
MKQAITAKLKLELSDAQKKLVRETTLAYRDALNYASKIAFENNKMSSGVALQKKVYNQLRSVFGLPAQMSCNVPRQVGATYKSLWTKVKQNAEAISNGRTKRRYKGLDQAPKFVSRTCTLNYKRDYSFVKGKVSLITLSGRIKVKYSGYYKHLELIKSGAKIGAAKIWYDQAKKTYYLLVTLNLDVPELKPEDIKEIKGVDVGQRYLAVVTSTQNQTQFFSGKQVRHKAEKYHKARKTLQQKGTRSAKRRLIALSGKERRFTAAVNHQISKKIVSRHSLIGLENLKHIRERTNRRSSKKASKKQKKANRNRSLWAFAELHGYCDYKAILSNSLAIKVPAQLTSQCCPKCGHISKQNRPNKGLTFRCVACNHTLHSDLVGARNIALRTLLLRQDFESTGRISAVPHVSHEEAKANYLPRFLELRWSADTIPTLNEVGWGS